MAISCLLLSKDGVFMNNKSRKVKEFEYNDKYSMIPIDLSERLNWMFDAYKLSDKKCNEIIEKRDQMLSKLFYHDFNIVLFEEPEGTQRSRFRIVNRSNFANAAMSNSQFVHVYSPHAKEDNVYMKRLTDQELIEVNQLITTPCNIEYTTFHKMPSGFNITDTFLAEIGLIRPMVKPDWDNMGKKYSDMSNHTIWLDDSFVIDGIVHKFYSILPRVEIKIRYLNMLYNKKQYDYVTNRKDFQEFDCNVEYFRMEE